MAGLARVIERHMDNKDLLMKAVDNYEAYSPSYRKILKLLVELSIDDVAYTTVLQLSNILVLSRQVIYEALYVFEKEKIIEIIKKDRGKISSIVLKPNKLNQIVQYYNVQIEMLNKYRKNNE